MTMKEVDHLKIVIPGNPPIKKNNMKAQFWTYVNGKKVPLRQPIWFYAKAYREWALKAMQHLALLKFNRILPTGLLEGPYFMTTIFYREKGGRVDISNLLEATQDILVGNSGIKNTISKDKYAILQDDNFKIVSPAIPIVLIEPRYPRTEIYLSRFDYALWAKTYSLIHSGLKVGKPDSLKIADQVQVIYETPKEST